MSQAAAPRPDFAATKRFVVDGLPLCSIRSINDLGNGAETIYRTLIPDPLLTQFQIDPVTLCDAHGHRLAQMGGPPGASSMELKIWHAVDARDPLLYLQLADTAQNQLAVLLLIANNPASPRFDTDRDCAGNPTDFGTSGRNLEAETAAMRAGLAPGQVRRGLRITRQLMPNFEAFVSRLGHQIFFMEPLAYHTAIQFEAYGCAYTLGRARMEWINREFGPCGELTRRLDGSTPFRQPSAPFTLRGRSWAIHDGILGERFSGIRMYKRIGVHANVCTFPDGVW
jgi:hypothetical protein